MNGIIDKLFKTGNVNDKSISGCRQSEWGSKLNVNISRLVVFL